MTKIQGKPGARSVALILVAWGVAAVVALVVVVVASARPSPQPVAGGGLGMPNLAKPLIDARAMTVAAAQSAAGYMIPMPTSASAGRRTLTKVWESRNREVALVFAGGKVTLLIRPAAYADPAAWFRKIVHESPGSAAVGRVKGQPAVVIQPNTDPYGPNPAWVEFYQNGLDFNVISTIYDTRTLLSIAESVSNRES